MAEQAFAVVCAWCNRIVNAPARRRPVTHTICPSCLERALTLQNREISASSSSETFDLPPEYLGDIFRH